MLFFPTGFINIYIYINSSSTCKEGDILNHYYTSGTTTTKLVALGRRPREVVFMVRPD